MKLETYAKVAIIFGIVISSIITGIVLSYSVGDMFGIYHIGEEIAWVVLDKDRIIQQMMDTPSYISFIERFSDSREEVVMDKFHITTIVEAINPNSMNTLRLELNYNTDKNRVWEFIECGSLTNNSYFNSHNTIFLDTFIEKTNCLEDDFEFPSKWRDAYHDLR